MHSTSGPPIPVRPETPSSPAALDRAVESLRTRLDAWRRLGPADRADLLGRLQCDVGGVAERWVEAGLRAKNLDPQSPAAAEEWLGGPYAVLRYIRLLRRALSEIATRGTPRIPGPVGTSARGQVVAGVFPTDLYDRVLFRGYTAEVWMEPGLAVHDLEATQAQAYRGNEATGGVALVLGAGNVGAIPAMDVLHKLFVADRVVLLKMSPVVDYLGPVFDEGLRALVEAGFLRIVYGGAREGDHLCRHDAVDEVHLTGSASTYDSIVFGTGEEGIRRAGEQKPLLAKPVTAELGNVSPVIVVPGPWSPADLEFHAANIVSQLAVNAGFNCTSARVIVNHAGWDRREPLLRAIRRLLAGLPTRHAYYPGAAARHRGFLEAHPGAERYGAEGEGRLPWTLIAGLDPADREDMCFTTEAFCSLFAETAIATASVPEYIGRAVAFANEVLWGSLCATLIVHPASLQDMRVAEAVEHALAELRYGAVAVNQWVALAFTMGTTTWGGFPGNSPRDIGSGTGVVHNALMFARPQKSVVRAPFRTWLPPPWFVSNPRAAQVAARLTRFEAAPSLPRLPAVLAAAVSG